MRRPLPADSKTARVLVALRESRGEAPSWVFGPPDIDARTLSALLHNMARRGVVTRVGRGVWRLSPKGRRLAARVASGT